MTRVANVVKLFRALKSRDQTVIARPGSKQFDWSLFFDGDFLPLRVSWEAEALVLEALLHGDYDAERAKLAARVPTPLGEVRVDGDLAVYETRLPLHDGQADVDALQAHALTFARDVQRWTRETDALHSARNP